MPRLRLRSSLTRPVGGEGREDSNPIRIAWAVDRRDLAADPVALLALGRSRAGHEKPDAACQDDARGEYEHSRCFVQFRRTHRWSSPLA